MQSKTESYFKSIRILDSLFDTKHASKNQNKIWYRMSIFICIVKLTEYFKPKFVSESLPVILENLLKVVPLASWDYVNPYKSTISLFLTKEHSYT